MTPKKKALISACATSSIGMMWLVTSAVLAYMIGTSAAQGASPQQIVMVMTIQPLVGVFMAFLTGPISMRVSKKLLMCAACVLTVISGIIYGVFGGHCSIGLLYVGAALSGIVSALASTVPNSLMAQYATSFEERGKFSGYNNAFMQGGALLMSSVGGLLGASRWQNAFLLWFLAIPVLVLVLVLCPNEPAVEHVEKKDVVKLSQIPGTVWLLCLHFTLFFVCCYTFSVYISSYIITEFQLGTSFHTGLAASILTIAAVLASAFYARYSGKLGKCVVHFENVDLAEAKRTVGKTSCITGNFPVYLLEYGTVEQVQEEVKRQIDIGAPGGGFIFETNASIENVKRKNLEAMYDTARSYGKR